MTVLGECDICSMTVFLANNVSESLLIIIYDIVPAAQVYSLGLALQIQKHRLLGINTTVELVED